jgi:hypothetical protein
VRRENIMENQKDVTIFFITDGSNNIKHHTMFLSETKAKEAVDHYQEFTGRYYTLSSITIPFVGKYISQVEVYYGFDYSFSLNGGSSINDVISKSELYPSTELAKNSELWKTNNKRALVDATKHNFYENRICSKDGFDDFFYGDIMEGKFNMEIKRYKVYKGDS